MQTSLVILKHYKNQTYPSHLICTSTHTCEFSALVAHLPSVCWESFGVSRTGGPCPWCSGDKRHSPGLHGQPTPNLRLLRGGECARHHLVHRGKFRVLNLSGITWQLAVENGGDTWCGRFSPVLWCLFCTFFEERRRLWLLPASFHPCSPCFTSHSHCVPRSPCNLYPLPGVEAAPRPGEVVRARSGPALVQTPCKPPCQRDAGHRSTGVQGFCQATRGQTRCAQSALRRVCLLEGPQPPCWRLPTSALTSCYLKHAVVLWVFLLNKQKPLFNTKRIFCSPCKTVWMEGEVHLSGRNIRGFPAKETKERGCPSSSQRWWVRGVHTPENLAVSRLRPGF